ncbi:MAG: tRNA glutamyl-Q(34) synthetase GluQRS [Nitrosomonadales bacterium]|nr:tRNA glutamyl-Q(34) synthetase GluQRS [Nitrosomonadales bacterium]
MARWGWSLKKKLSPPEAYSYRGRFAPSPTGPLHFGSLAAAVGSYLDAKHHHGNWLVRMEDLDIPRCVPGAADDILRTLEAFGLHSDEPVLYQSQRTAAYEAALHRLQASGAVYPCCCTRKEIADSALHGIEGLVYPGTCRNGIPQGREARAWRVRTDLHPSPSSLPPSQVGFTDALQGRMTQHLESEIGDFVVKRADGLFAYQLAVVVDDAFQHITHVVRGADLLASTPRQIYLQQLLEMYTPAYAHLPVAVNAQGEKLSKQTLAPAITTEDTAAILVKVLEFLRQQPPAELRQGSVEEVLNWAVANWRPGNLQGCRQLPAEAD